MLQQDSAAWTGMLRALPSLEEITVTEVAVARANRGRLTRYLLSLEDHSDSIPFVGKKTNATEARFYRDVAPSVRRLVPHCWLYHLAHDWSWIVLDDVPDDRPPSAWTGEDVETVVALLASFHGTYWNQQEQLDKFDWLTPFLSRYPGGIPEDGFLTVWEAWDRLPGHNSALSPHGLRHAGRLAPTFIRAAVGLETLRRLGGWPGIIERPHLDAIATLLDDPLPMLQPLRELPATLLHGNPVPRHWNLTLFDDYLLLDWANVTVGPAIYDLVHFLEGVEQLRTGRQMRANGADWPLSEETMLDSYLLRLHRGLAHCDVRAIRLALPAARCLYLLAVWLPRLGDWFQPFVGSPLTWKSLTQMSDEQLHRAGFGRLAGRHSYLAELFFRFGHAARML